MSRVKQWEPWSQIIWAEGFELYLRCFILISLIIKSRPKKA